MNGNKPRHRASWESQDSFEVPNGSIAIEVPGSLIGISGAITESLTTTVIGGPSLGLKVVFCALCGVIRFIVLGV